MTTPSAPQDPFAQAPTGATPPPPGAEFANAPAYAPPPAYAPIQVRADNSLGKIATWATALTGLVALLTVGSALWAPRLRDAYQDLVADPENASPFATTSPFDFVSLPALIASYVLLALWMSKVRSAMVARGERPGGPPAVEWWGWFIPFASLVLPVLGMRALTKGKASAGLVAGWWVAYLLYGFVGAIPAFAQFSAIDWSTGELTNADAFNVLPPAAWAASVTLIVSWVFLALVIRSTTAAEKATQAAH